MAQSNFERTPFKSTTTLHLEVNGNDIMTTCLRILRLSRRAQAMKTYSSCKCTTKCITIIVTFSAYKIKVNVNTYRSRFARAPAKCFGIYVWTCNLRKNESWLQNKSKYPILNKMANK